MGWGGWGEGHDAVARLSLANVGARVSAARSLARLLLRPYSTSHALTHLQLSSNQLGDAGATALASALTPTTLTSSAPGLVELELSDAAIRGEGGAALARMLTRNSSLLRLDLSWNAVRGKGGTNLVQAIRAFCSLRSLNLAWNGIGSAGQLLGEELANNDTLIELDVSCCRLGRKEGEAIAPGLLVNTRLERLVMDGNFLCEGAVALHQALEARSLRSNGLLWSLVNVSWDVASQGGALQPAATLCNTRAATSDAGCLLDTPLVSIAERSSPAPGSMGVGRRLTSTRPLSGDDGRDREDSLQQGSDDAMGDTIAEQVPDTMAEDVPDTMAEDVPGETVAHGRHESEPEENRVARATRTISQGVAAQGSRPGHIVTTDQQAGRSDSPSKPAADGRTPAMSQRRSTRLRREGGRRADVRSQRGAMDEHGVVAATYTRTDTGTATAGRKQGKAVDIIDGLAARSMLNQMMARYGARSAPPLAA